MKTTKTVKPDTKKPARNWKPLIEKTKTILLVMFITGGVMFYLGVQYQKAHTLEMEQKVQSAIANVKK